MEENGGCSESRTWVVIFCLIASSLTLMGAEPSVFPNAKDGWTSVLYSEPHGDIPWRFKIFTNEKNGDLLSFAMRSLVAREPTDLEKWTDTTTEIFPTGHPYWAKTKANSGLSVDTLKYRVERFKVYDSASQNRKELSVLAYVNVVEAPDRDSQMAIGYLLVEKGNVFMMQHTSKRPITSATAKSIFTSLLAKRDSLPGQFVDLDD